MCLGQSPNQKCWDHYCRTGGVRYEFEYDPTFKSDISRKSVEYDDSKTHNLYEFLIRQNLDSIIRNLFLSQANLNFTTGRILLNWIKSGQAYGVTLEHVSNEIPFKKKKEFEFEDEFRFVQLIKSEGPVVITNPLEHQKANLDNLGLKLIGIATSDTSKVKAELGNTDIEVYEISFS